MCRIEVKIAVAAQAANDNNLGENVMFSRDSGFIFGISMPFGLAAIMTVSGENSDDCDRRCGGLPSH